MNQTELQEIIEKEGYCKPRKSPTEAECVKYLAEVNYHCPLCGVSLSPSRHKKRNKLYQIAHIYPNSPTVEEYETLKGLEKLGDNSESFLNKIALCHRCHTTHDFHTKQDEYLHLLELKKQLYKKIAVRDLLDDMSLESELAEIINRLVICDVEPIDLNYNPVRVDDKFGENPGNFLLCSKVKNYVVNYYTFLRGLFTDREGYDGFSFEALCCEVKAAFIKAEASGLSKEEIFNELVNWVKIKTGSNRIDACEVIISFFVQNCEVFRENT